MMLCDASPVIALINQGDNNHQRCVDALSSMSAPLITTCYCFTEAMYILGRYGGWLAQQELWGYVADKLLVIYDQTSDNLRRMKILMEQYRNVPMDLADASLVATAEMLNQKQIFTLDRDFYIYRLWGNLSFEVIP